MNVDMETMSAGYISYPQPSQTASHLRESRMTNPTSTKATTRTVQAGNMIHPTEQHSLSQPASQESFVSIQSSIGSSIPNFHASDSNLSQLTADTDPTSPLSSAPSKHLNGNGNNSQDSTRQLSHKSRISRDRTPENANQTPQLPGDGALASPMSITSPVVTNGTKRTASGHVKNAPSLPNTPYTGVLQERDSRRGSTSSSGSRVGEMAATLKTRLGYAMAKVQHGWEHKSLVEVEQLAAETSRHNHRKSMSHYEQSRPGTSGLSNGTANLSFYENNYVRSPSDVQQPPSKRHSANYSHYMSPPQHVYPAVSHAPRLQPAPDFRPTSSDRAYFQTGAAQGLQPQNFANNATMSPPRTPVQVAPPRRPATIRTDTQTAEAERDALQALWQLGSPRTSQLPNSQSTQPSSQGQMSPFRSDVSLTPRKVAFSRSDSASTSSSGLTSHARDVTESRARIAERLEDDQV